MLDFEALIRNRRIHQESGGRKALSALARDSRSPKEGVQQRGDAPPQALPVAAWSWQVASLYHMYSNICGKIMSDNDIM